MPHQRAKQRKDAFLIGHTQNIQDGPLLWSNMFSQAYVKRLGINYIHQGIPEQLDDLWKGNFVRSWSN